MIVGDKIFLGLIAIIIIIYIYFIISYNLKYSPCVLGDLRPGYQPIRDDLEAKAPNGDTGQSGIKYHNTGRVLKCHEDISKENMELLKNGEVFYVLDYSGRICGEILMDSYGVIRESVTECKR